MILHQDIFGNTQGNLKLPIPPTEFGLQTKSFRKFESQAFTHKGGRMGKRAGPQENRCLNTGQVRVEIQQIVEVRFIYILT